MGVTYYIMRENLIWREFNLAIFYDSPNRQIKVLAKFSGYTVYHHSMAFLCIDASPKRAGDTPGSCDKERKEGNGRHTR